MWQMLHLKPHHESSMWIKCNVWQTCFLGYTPWDFPGIPTHWNNNIIVYYLDAKDGRFRWGLKYLIWRHPWLLAVLVPRHNAGRSFPQTAETPYIFLEIPCLDVLPGMTSGTTTRRFCCFFFFFSFITALRLELLGPPGIITALWTVARLLAEAMLRRLPSTDCSANENIYTKRMHSTKI